MSWARPVVGLLVGSVLAAGVVEAAVRLLRPTPRVQVVRLDSDSLTFDMSEDVVLWHDPMEATWYREDGCAAGDLPVLLLAGDSIPYVTSGHGQDARLAGKLQQAMAEGGTPVCVVDVSQSGYLPHQVLSSAQRADAMFHADAVMMWVWKPDRHLIRHGNALYDDLLVTDDADYPASPLPLPAAAHHWLFEHARSWEFLTLALGTWSVAKSYPSDVSYRAAIAWTAREDLPLMMVEASPLDRPFADTMATWGEPLDNGSRPWQAAVREAALAAGSTYVRLAELLVDADFLAIRHDSCCHYNEQGHALIAQRLLPGVQALFATEGRP